MKKENIIQSIKVVTLGLMVAVGISYAFAWTPPTSTPPNGNVSAPVNVGGTLQTKTGSLWSDNFIGSSGGGYFGGDLEIENGKGITLGGVKKTAWPSGGGSADWNSITNKPAGFADDVDDVSNVTPGQNIYKIIYPACGDVDGLTTKTSCKTSYKKDGLYTRCDGVCCSNNQLTCNNQLIGRMINP